MERVIVFAKNEMWYRLKRIDARGFCIPRISNLKKDKETIIHYQREVFADLDVVLESQAASWMLNLLIE